MATKAKQTAPEGSTVVCPYLMTESVESQMEFLVNVFHAKIINDSNRVDGMIQHGEVLIGDTVIMMGRASNQYPARQSMNYVYVDDTDEVFRRALTHKADPIMPPDNRSYGAREAGFADRFGNQWWIAQLLNTEK